MVVKGSRVFYHFEACPMCIVALWHNGLHMHMLNVDSVPADACFWYEIRQYAHALFSERRGDPGCGCKHREGSDLAGDQVGCHLRVLQYDAHKTPKTQVGATEGGRWIWLGARKTRGSRKVITLGMVVCPSHLMSSLFVIKLVRYSSSGSWPCSSLSSPALAHSTNWFSEVFPSKRAN